MSEKHFLSQALEDAEADPTKDFHLSMMAESYYISFFKREDNKDQWPSRIESLKTLDLQKSPLFEAINFYGESRIEKNFKKGVASAEKFEQMEKLSLKKNWYWTLVYSLENAVHIYKTYNQTENLKAISLIIIDYLNDKKDSMPTITVIRLVELYKTLLLCSEKTNIQKIIETALDFSERKLGEDPYHFQRSFLFDAIDLARFLKNEADVEKFQNRIIEKWIEEANLKGKGSNLIKFAVLESALDCSIRFGNKDKTEEIKLMLSKTDFSNELKEITLPKEQLEEFEKAAKQHYEKIEKAIAKYVDKLSQIDSISILMNLANEPKLIALNVAESEKLAKDIAKNSPMLSIFNTILDTGHKIIQVEPGESKERSRLNEQLIPGLRETIWFVSEITDGLEERGRFSASMIEEFMSRSSCIDNNILEIADFGLYHHFNSDYVASISILVPMIEATLFNYLKGIGANVSSVEGKVIQNRELGGLLNLKEVEENFGRDFQYFMKLFLVEGDAINFRNRLAHGDLDVKEFHKQVSSILLFIIIRIAAKTVK
jgi:Domain of unknown function (DUF4209)